MAYPNDPRWHEVALHGLRFLREAMHDEGHGGWFWMVGADGTPMMAATKHAHGTAYLIDAAVEVFRLTGDAGALEIAQQAFEWLDETLHDNESGGYHGWATREGNLIRSSRDLPPELGARTTDPLGHGIGLKDANVHSDLLEAFGLLLEIWNEPRVRERLAETYQIVTRRFLTSNGSMHYMVYPDLSPVPSVQRHGYPLQTALRMPVAAHFVGESLEHARIVGRTLADAVLAAAWDVDRGGVVDAGPAAEPFSLGNASLWVSTRSWWVQTEALKILLLLALTDDHERYQGLFERSLDFVDRQFIDERHRGWYTLARADHRFRLGAHGSHEARKGDAWKDASHEADFYLTAIRMLRGLTATEAF